MRIINADIPDYYFDKKSNPYSFDSDPQLSLSKIASKIETIIDNNINAGQFIIRGINSANHSKLKREELVEIITLNGNDMYESEDERNTIYATNYHKGVILKILEGFHKYKPKCDERPQQPVDVWIVLCADAYENIEYMHERHKVLAKDKWKIKNKSNIGLELILTIN